MDNLENIDQFQLLEEKIDNLIELVTTLKREKESLAEKNQLREERLTDLTTQLESLNLDRDKVKQRVVSLLEKLERV